jgi:hypothetical protein
VNFQSMLANHNAYRSGVVTPPQSPLQPMVWDVTLAASVLNWVQRCQFGYMPTPPANGQLLYATAWSTWTSSPPDTPTLQVTIIEIDSLSRSFSLSPFLSPSLSLFLSICVCLRKRERERKKEMFVFLLMVLLCAVAL